MRINIEIERLVLNGFDFHDHKRISAALEQELAWLIRENGLPEGFTQGDKIPIIYPPSFTAPEDMNPRKLGTEVARSIFRAWKTRFSEPNMTHHKPSI